MIPSCFAVAI